MKETQSKYTYLYQRCIRGDRVGSVGRDDGYLKGRFHVRLVKGRKRKSSKGRFELRTDHTPTRKRKTQ